MVDVVHTIDRATDVKCSPYTDERQDTQLLNCNLLFTQLWTVVNNKSCRNKFNLFCGWDIIIITVMQDSNFSGASMYMYV